MHPELVASVPEAGYHSIQSLLRSHKRHSETAMKPRRKCGEGICDLPENNIRASLASRRSEIAQTIRVKLTPHMWQGLTATVVRAYRKCGESFSQL